MLNRCTNPNVKRYPAYGGRGITVCERWYVFENFLEDMGEKPAGLSIERVDNNQGYYKENCRWATAREQWDNMRSTLWVAHAGKNQTLAAWAKELGLRKKCLEHRYTRGLRGAQLLHQGDLRSARIKR